MTSIVDTPDFGHYQLLARLGERARGPAYIARRKDGGDALFAIELSAFASDEDALARAFARDIDGAARIRHRNVVSIVERGENAAGHYVVTEHVEGGTLAELEERHRAIRPPRLVAACAMDVLYGLEAAHVPPKTEGDAAPVIHGALSADHVLVGLDGGCRIFGFGNVRPRVQTRPSLRSRAGTGYLAPEQLTGGEVDHRADLFSLGVVLWNALTGKRLFHDRLEHATMTKVLERKVPRPSAVGLSPPPAFDAVVQKALERDPARRFQRAAEMAEALREVARAASCLAGTTEVAEWIGTTFGSDLAARRRTIRELGTRVTVPVLTDLPVLPPLGAPPAETARDELSTDEIRRAIEPPPRAPTATASMSANSAAVTMIATPPAAPLATPAAPPLAPITQPVAFPGRTGRRQLAVVAASAFVVVASVLTWRWSTVRAPVAVAVAPAPPVRPAVRPILALEVTLLEVTTIEPPPEEPAAPDDKTADRTAADRPAADRPATAKTVAPEPAAPPRRAEPARPEPARPARKQVRPGAARPDAREPDKPAEQRPEPPRPEPPKPEPPRPALESNPYLYK